MASTFGFHDGNGGTPAPAPKMQTLSSAYIDFTSPDADSKNWAQQYVPDLMEKEAEVFGNRSVSGFLEMVGAEEAMTADQVVWSEQGRLHLSGTGAMTSTDGLFVVTKDSDGVGTGDIGIRIGDMILISDANQTLRGYVTGTETETSTISTTGQFTAKCYDAADFTGISATDGAVSFLVFGSEYEKGKEGRGGAIQPNFKSYSNQPIIMKDKYEISGSDASQIGWVEVSGEDGQSGYLWYLKSAGDTKTRFTDYCEMALVESVKAATSSGVAGMSGNLKGTEGLFAAVEDRGHVQFGFQNSIGGGDNLALSDFDDILKEFDKQGAIEEYMIFCNRTYALEIDDLLATMNADSAGTSYGVFNNEADMALNLGFTGFRRGSYDFYKTDWKYLNDSATRGSIKDVSAVIASADAALGTVAGMFVPAGTSTVYDQQLGKNLKRPFLHVRYRASQADDRRFKTWTTGSVGAASSDLDAMEMHFLTERCLVVQGANNFMMIRG